jgi:hypothetical protein
MADTIKIPGFGPVKKQTAYVVGAGLVLVGGAAWYRSRNAPADIEATESSPINPATGFPYGSTEDANALAGQGFSYSGGIIGDAGLSSGGGGSGQPTAGAFTTNGAWSQAAEDYLSNTVGLDSNVVGNALGKYITGAPLTPDQVNIIQQAIAFTNYPPVNGPSGYPPSFRTSAEPPSTPTPTPSAGKPGKVGGLRAVSSSTSSIRIGWSAVSGAKGYAVYSVGSAGRQWIGNVTGTSFTRTRLKRRTRYQFWVAAYNSAGYGSLSSPLFVSTR